MNIPKIYSLQSGGYEVSFENEVLSTFPSSHERDDLERALDLAREYAAGFQMAVSICEKNERKNENLLAHMARLNAEMELKRDDTPEETIAAYGPLLDEAVTEFLPLVKKLVFAGLFTIYVEADPMAEADEFSEAYYHPKTAFDNGNIWLAGLEFSGGAPWVQEGDLKPS